MQLQLCSDTQRIIKQVKEISKKNIVFRENNSLNTYAIAKIARSRMPEHIIYYRSDHKGILNYIIAHECGHIIRICNEKRRKLMPYSDSATTKKAISDIEKNSKNEYPEEIKAKIYPMLINGIITQLTSIPEDIRIEKWIYNNYPEIKSFQKDALIKQCKDISATITEKTRALVPEILYKGSGVINYLYLKSLEDIIPSDTLKEMNNKNFYQTAINIYNEVIKIMDREDSLSNSIDISDHISSLLGFEGWYKWKDFEDIPDGYEDAIYF